MGRPPRVGSAQPGRRALSDARGIEVAADRGVAVVRLSTVPSAADAARFGVDALAGLRTLGGKGLHGMIVDLTACGAADGAAHARIATAMGPLLADWEGRGLPVAVVVSDKRGALEATRVIAGSAPRWGRVVSSLDLAERFVASR